MSKISMKFAKRSDDFTVTICNNGYFIALNGRDSSDEWVDDRFICNNFDELVETILEYESLQRA